MYICICSNVSIYDLIALFMSSLIFKLHHIILHFFLDLKRNFYFNTLWFILIYTILDTCVSLSCYCHFELFLLWNEVYFNQKYLGDNTRFALIKVHKEIFYNTVRFISQVMAIMKMLLINRYFKRHFILSLMSYYNENSTYCMLIDASI